MNYFIPQIDHSDCGFACLKMMIATLYQNKNALFIKQDEEHGAYSLQELFEEGTKYGITLQGIEVSDKNELNNFKKPLIVLLNKGGDVFHYVLVTKIKRRMVYYSDPNEGECRLSKKSFNRLWTGNALIIEEFNKQDISFTSHIPESKNFSIMTSAFQLLSALFLVVGIYFIDDKSKIYIPLLFLGLAIISEIILRALLVKRMENFDSSFVKDAFVDRGKYSLFYSRYEEYKKASISTGVNIFFTFISILFISSIVLLNNIYNAFLILIPLFLAIIDTKYISSHIRNKEQIIAMDERELGSLKNVDVLKRQMDKIHMRSYKLAKVILAKRYVYLSILAITALLTTVFNETFSLPYVIFYFAITYMLLEQYTAFMKYPESKNEALRCKVKLNNVLYEN